MTDNFLNEILELIPKIRSQCVTYQVHNLSPKDENYWIQNVGPVFQHGMWFLKIKKIPTCLD